MGKLSARRLAFALLVAALVAAACGSEDDDPSASPTSAPAVTTTLPAVDVDTVAEVTADLEPAPEGSGAVTTHGLAALYRFADPGAEVTDRSGVRTPAPLRRDGDRDGLRWLDSPPSIAVGSGSGLAAQFGPDALDRLQGERAVELWFDPAGALGTIAELGGEDGPSLRVDLFEDDDGTSLMRLIVGPDVVLSTEYDPDAGWTHVIGSTGPSGSWLNVDGQEVATGPGLDDLPDAETFTLAGTESSWAGALAFAAVYGRVVVGSEAENHFDIGPGALISDGPAIVAVGDVVAQVGETTEIPIGYFDPTGDETELTVESSLDVAIDDRGDDGTVLVVTPTEDDVGTRQVNLEVAAGDRLAARTFLVFVVDAPWTVDRVVVPELVDGEVVRRILGPADALVDGAELVVADRDVHQIFQVFESGPEAWFGSAEPGFAGDGEPATVNSQLNLPSGVALGPDGSLYVADEGNHRIRVVRPDGTLDTVAGTGEPGFAVDGTAAVDAPLFRPVDVAVGPDGTVYVAELGNHMVRSIDPDGMLGTVMGTGIAGQATPRQDGRVAPLTSPVSVAVGPDGAVHIADAGTHQVWRVADDGLAALVAGTGISGYSGDGGPGIEASLAQPSGLAVDPDGRVFIADTANRRIRRVTPDGVISTFAGSGSDVWGSDGTAALATGMTPVELALDPDGALIVVDPVAGVVARLVNG